MLQSNHGSRSKGVQIALSELQEFTVPMQDSSKSTTCTRLQRGRHAKLASMPLSDTSRSMRRVAP